MSINNQGSFIGRFCADMELKQTQGGKAYLRNTVAVDGYKKDSPSIFVPVTFWEQKAEFVAKHFSKGDPVGITYALRSGKQKVYSDGAPVLGKDGEELEQERLEIMVMQVSFMPANTPKDKSVGSAAPKQTQQTAAPQLDLNDFEEIDDDDIPF